VSPDYGAGQVILLPSVFACLLDREPIGQIIHAKIAQHPCPLVLNVLALGDCDADLPQ
jgi:hypothetical protein